MSESFSLYPFHIFRVVAAVGSVTGAAQELFISQPAVSAHLKTVEQRCGAPLFERTPRGVSLTAAGREVLEHINRLFALYEELPGLVDAAQGRVSGEVVVAASSTPGAYRVPVLLRQFQERYPEARPSLMVGDTADVLQWLREYRVPLGVVGEMHAGQDFHKLQIGSDELTLVTAAGDELAAAPEITGEHVNGRTLFIRERGSSTREAAEKLLGHLLPAFGRVVEIGSTEAIKQSVVAGLGMAVLSSWSIELEAPAGLLLPVSDHRLKKCRNFYLVRRQDRVLTGSAAALWDCLHTCRPEEKTGQVRKIF